MLCCLYTGARLHTDLLSVSCWPGTHSTAQYFSHPVCLRGWVKALPASFRPGAYKGRFALMCLHFSLRLVLYLTLNLGEEPPLLFSLLLNVPLLRRSAFFRLIYFLMFNTGRKYKSPMILPRSKTCQPTLTHSITPSTWLCKVHTQNVC